LGKEEENVLKKIDYPTGKIIPRAFRKTVLTCESNKAIFNVLSNTRKISLSPSYMEYFIEETKIYTISKNNDSIEI
jgi:hypothetical protein